MNQNLCLVDGCCRVIRDDNKAGVCTDHRALSQIRCAISNCTGGAVAGGMCSKHYSRHVRGAPLESPTCPVEGCEKKLRRNNTTGFCYGHRYPTLREPARVCAEPGCEAPILPHNKRGWCPPHHIRNTSAENCAKYAARKLDLWVEDVHRDAVFDRHLGVCHICGAPVDQSRWDMDHVIPLIQGGPHCYDNVAPAHPSCNRSKQDRWSGSPVASVDAAARSAFAAFHGRPFD